uniref:Uncharacterized protein n=1 Tax=Arundo donax TaxID=35708 RepID=A0A0A9CRM8_ARUDO
MPICKLVNYQIFIFSIRICTSQLVRFRKVDTNYCTRSSKHSVQDFIFFENPALITFCRANQQYSKSNMT